MATGALITPERYLSTRFEREPEFVHGELVEKSLPNKKHGRTQLRLCMLLGGAGYGCTEVRMKLAEDLFRIPDFAMFESDPGEGIPESAPLLIIEIGSPDDRVLDIEKKLEEYRAWGVAHIWFVEPELRKLYIYERGLVNVQQLDLPQFNLTIMAPELFA
jgi:Uma2 family endonuclease